MKIKSLHIDSYKHLSTINFDFTYPEGHVNAGSPLNKICIIGQSATGKTSILELVKDCISQLNKAEIVGGFLHDYYHSNFNGRLELLHDDILQDDNVIQLTKNTIIKNGKEFRTPEGSNGGSVTKLISANTLKLLYLSAEIISKEAVNIFSQSPLDILNELATDKYAGLQNRLNNDHYIYEFGHEANAEVWFSLLYKILDYRKRFTQMASEWINKGAIADFERMAKHFANWSVTNENPLIPFANECNPLLNKLNLEIDLINTEYTIPVKSKYKDEVIQFGNLSTGTKGLLLSMFPLYELDTTDSIVLLDEPERSLFPDMQIDLIKHYQAFAKNAQIIVATHSPFIAAAFEPEERFILYFDGEGKVSLRKGESPIGDDPNDILSNDFKVDYYNEFGKKAYKDYLSLKRRLVQEKNPERKQELIVEMAELGDKYNF